MNTIRAVPDVDETREAAPNTMREGDETKRYHFNFDHFKWVASMLIAIVGIYVVSERRATATDISAVYLDAKVEEIKNQNKEQGTAINARLDALDKALGGVALANNNTTKEQEFLRRQFEEYRSQEFAANQLRDTYIKNTRERIIAIEGRLKMATKE